MKNTEERCQGPVGGLGVSNHRHLLARAFTSFLLGHLLLESSQAGADIGPLDVVGDTGAGSAAEPDASGDDLAAHHPLLAELRQALSEDHAASDFEE